MSALENKERKPCGLEVHIHGGCGICTTSERMGDIWIFEQVRWEGWGRFQVWKRL